MIMGAHSESLDPIFFSLMEVTSIIFFFFLLFSGGAIKYVIVGEAVPVKVFDCQKEKSRGGHFGPPSSLTKAAQPISLA